MPKVRFSCTTESTPVPQMQKPARTRVHLLCGGTSQSPWTRSSHSCLIRRQSPGPRGESQHLLRDQLC